MDLLSFLKLSHMVGAVLFGGGCLAAFVAHLDAWRATDLVRYFEALRYLARVNILLAWPGAALLGLSGTFLILEIGYAVPKEPWLLGMAALFTVQFMIGSLLPFWKGRGAPGRKKIIDHKGTLALRDMQEASHSPVLNWSQSMSAPLLGLIVYCGAARPETWLHLSVSAGFALVATQVIFLMLIGTSPSQRIDDQRSLDRW